MYTRKQQNYNATGMSSLATDFESTLCASCGLCCDGTIFCHVSLEEGEDAKHYSELGAEPDKQRAHFPLPCAAYDSATGCAIYDSRPAACRWFHCHLLVQLQSGKITRAHALEKIDLTKQARKDVLLKIGKQASFIEPCTLSFMGKGVAKAPLPPGEGLGRGNQKKRSGVVNEPLYADHLNIYHYPFMFTSLFGADASDPESAAFVKEHAEAYLALAALKMLLKKHFRSGDERRPDTTAKEDDTLLKENIG